jgi:hypothetical protein
MKKETRRRKKRKIFYPRSKWITFSIYKKFLKQRYLLSDSSFSSLRLLRLRAADQRTSGHPSGLRTPPLLLRDSDGGASLRRGVGEQEAESKLNKKIYRKLKNEELPFGVRKNEFWLNNLRSRYLEKESIFKNTQDFYLISKTVFIDLKRVLMKSNWLKNYLNPYLNKVKLIYKEMENSSKNFQHYLNLRSFILFIYGSLKDSPFFQTQNFHSLKYPKILEFSKFYLNNSLGGSGKDLTKDVGVFSKAGFFVPNPTASLLQRDSDGKAKPFEELGTKPFASSRDLLKLNSELTNETSIKFQLSINLLEYNRIIYQRFQRIILNIRENLNLNGQIKNRSKKTNKNIRAFLKRDYKKNYLKNGLPNNQNSNFLINIIKNNILQLVQMFSYNLELAPQQTGFYYENSLNLSKNNLYWALNKTNILLNNNSSYFVPKTASKKLWETYKLREITKSNKTKKLIFNLFMKYQLGLSKSKTILDEYKDIIEKLNNQFNFLNKTNSLYLNSSELKMNEKELEIFFKDSLVKEGKIKQNISPTIYSFKSEQKLINIENKLKFLGLFASSAHPKGLLRWDQQQFSTSGARALRKQVSSKKSNKGSFSKNESFESSLVLQNQTYKTFYFRFLKQQLLKEKNFYKSYFNIDAYTNPLTPPLLQRDSDGKALAPQPGGEYAGPLLLEKTNPKKRFEIIKENYLNTKFNNGSSKKNIYQNNSSILNSLENVMKLSNNDSYWWSSFKLDSIFSTSLNLKSTELPNKSANPINNALLSSHPKGEEQEPKGTSLLGKLENFNFETLVLDHSSKLYIFASFLFHFCTLISFVSLGGIRTLIKFYFILTSKIFLIGYKICFLPFISNSRNSSISGAWFSGSLLAFGLGLPFGVKKQSQDNLLSSKSLQGLSKNKLISSEQKDYNLNKTYLKKSNTDFFNQSSNLLVYKSSFFKYLIGRKVTNYLSLENLNYEIFSNNQLQNWTILKSKTPQFLVSKEAATSNLSSLLSEELLLRNSETSVPASSPPGCGARALGLRTPLRGKSQKFIFKDFNILFSKTFYIKI